MSTENSFASEPIAVGILRAYYLVLEAYKQAKKGSFLLVKKGII